jgi:hypothetical protein
MPFYNLALLVSLSLDLIFQKVGNTGKENSLAVFKNMKNKTGSYSAYKIIQRHF